MSFVIDVTIYPKERQLGLQEDLVKEVVASMAQRRSTLSLILLLLGFLPVFLFGSPSSAQGPFPSFWFQDQTQVQALRDLFNMEYPSAETVPVAPNPLMDWWSGGDPAHMAVTSIAMDKPSPPPVNLLEPREAVILPPDPPGENTEKEAEKKKVEENNKKPETKKSSSSSSSPSSSAKKDSGPDPTTGFLALPSTGPGYYHYNCNGNDHWGTPETIALLQQVARTWKERHPNGPRLGYGDLSRRQGGSFPPHASHKTGKDVDLLYVTNGGKYSRSLTQELVDLFWATGKVSIIFFNDSQIKGVEPWPGHDDHLHVRFY